MIFAVVDIAGQQFNVGNNVKCGCDDTLFSLIDGGVNFEKRDPIEETTVLR